MPIQIFQPSYRVDECLSEIRDCLEKGWTGLGFKTIAFEDAWKDYTGLPYAHFLNSATAGLHLAVALLKRHEGWDDGDEIISTPLTFVSTNHVILHTGLKPVFADVDEYMCLDPIDVERKITTKTRAIMFVGIGGNTGQLQAVSDLCRERGLKLILDAAHLSGTKLHTRDPGHFADAAIYSFQAVKNLPTADSGMVCFQDPELDAAVRRMSWLGISQDTYQRSGVKGSYKWMYDVDEVGFKYHGNSIMAAIGLVQLKYLDEDNAYRRQIGGWYDTGFSGNKAIQPIPIAAGCDTSQHFYQVAVDDRDKVILGLYDQGIFPGVHYRDNTDYPMYSQAKGSCPAAHAMSERILSLPVHLNLTRDDIGVVVDALIELVGS